MEQDHASDGQDRQREGALDECKAFGMRSGLAKQPWMGNSIHVEVKLKAIIRVIWISWFMMSSVGAQAILQPPFGLRWGDSPEKLIDWAERHRLDVTIQLPGDQVGLHVIRISPRKGMLPDTKAKSVEGRFKDGKLIELTVDYEDEEVSAELMEARFVELKREMTKEHGTFTVNRQQKSVEDQYSTRTESFHREPVKGLFLLLVFTEVEDLLRKKKESRFSILYRNDNLKAEIESKNKSRKSE